MASLTNHCGFDPFHGNPTESFNCKKHKHLMTHVQNISRVTAANLGGLEGSELGLVATELDVEAVYGRLERDALVLQILDLLPQNSNLATV